MTPAESAAYAQQCHAACARQRIRQYVAIGGQDMTAASAARRCGVTERTIWRWRARLREGATP